MISKEVKKDVVTYKYIDNKGKIKTLNISINDDFNKSFDKLTEKDKINALITYKPIDKNINKIHIMKTVKDDKQTKKEEADKNKEILNKIFEYDTQINELNMIIERIKNHLIDDDDRKILDKHNLKEDINEISNKINELTNKKEEEQKKIYKLKTVDLKQYVNNQIGLMNKNYSYFTYKLLEAIKGDRDIKKSIEDIGSTNQTVHEFLNDERFKKLSSSTKKIIAELFTTGKIEKDYLSDVQLVNDINEILKLTTGNEIKMDDVKNFSFYNLLYYMKQTIDKYESNKATVDKWIFNKPETKIISFDIGDKHIIENMNILTLNEIKWDYISEDDIWVDFNQRESLKEIVEKLQSEKTEENEEIDKNKEKFRQFIKMVMYTKVYNMSNTKVQILSDTTLKNKTLSYYLFYDDKTDRLVVAGMYFNSVKLQKTAKTINKKQLKLLIDFNESFKKLTAIYDDFKTVFEINTRNKFEELTTFLKSENEEFEKEIKDIIETEYDEKLINRLIEEGKNDELYVIFNRLMDTLDKYKNDDNYKYLILFFKMVCQNCLLFDEEQQKNIGEYLTTKNIKSLRSLINRIIAENVVNKNNEKIEDEFDIDFDKMIDLEETNKINEILKSDEPYINFHSININFLNKLQKYFYSVDNNKEFEEKLKKLKEAYNEDYQIFLNIFKEFINDFNFDLTYDNIKKVEKTKGLNFKAMIEKIKNKHKDLNESETSETSEISEDDETFNSETIKRLIEMVKNIPEKQSNFNTNLIYIKTLPDYDKIIEKLEDNLEDFEMTFNYVKNNANDIIDELNKMYSNSFVKIGERKLNPQTGEKILPIKPIEENEVPQMPTPPPTKPDEPVKPGTSKGLTLADIAGRLDRIEGIINESMRIKPRDKKNDIFYQLKHFYD